jgi:phage-related protein
MFIDALSVSEKAKVATLFKMLGEGQTNNREKFGDLENGLYELKSFQIRIPFAYSQLPSEKGTILLTHGFRKKRDKTPPSEIDRAKRVLREDENLSKICSINDPKKRKNP